VGGAALCAAVAACGDGEGPTDALPPCAGPGTVVVSATDETQPRFTWTPSCTVARLAVERPQVEGVLVLWALTGGAAGIASGVRYGRVPRGAREETRPQSDAVRPGAVLSLYDAGGTFLGGIPLRMR
jgi:hypothetical protein